ncbi:tetrahydrofolate dehydrogenase/cyclohydrolase bifunctional protein [Heliomicrobium modesticaldum Ice1]|uniref:Bifunctional protein FolD n=1 Tax=Heliobacterium modesticaldum (strain ATCC 51547 / Ice1) TaxID=498761 RepID=FOLD_HELMI|nr:bifunctional 5,10-methylenetetrahydrofolate dehydrogenase/5,10-methenyltetrahydrofolate cyclohydrolase [Heliomicrobium modesticaldum]B0TFC9.1 RecName: Full=Bifunctional protein FolD; Includes: RecName: Full=Methylenetetrahydrofolate dehydrogenase; Includes: RecName: Full=Methenyltetrahydrofolate cyclohydrolase [Heliomicrobium modesticaldum Ice1]ABZ84446.1 tetrahydrofolate dehydrogenase/cyclohydrolase bifunctional protein [Heliomicrobium modesticaldum Ice1]
MTAQYIDGKAIAAQLRAEIKAEVASLREQGIVPKLAVILVGDDPASVVYARSKEKAAANLGIAFELFTLPGDTTEAALLALIERLNADAAVHGIMVELPLPKQISKEKVLEAIHPLKDVDGVHPLNRGYLMAGQPGLVPATPMSCMELLARSGVELAGKRVVIIGRGETVGKPLFFLLLRRNATVTVCHTRTKDLAAEVRRAEIVIAAAGKAGLVTGEMIAPDAVVIDAGINEGEDGNIVGDVKTAEAAERASLISPVPGGVGACTTALLFRNVLFGLKLQGGMAHE